MKSGIIDFISDLLIRFRFRESKICIFTGYKCFVNTYFSLENETLFKKILTIFNLFLYEVSILGDNIIIYYIASCILVIIQFRYGNKAILSTSKREINIIERKVSILNKQIF